MFLLTRLLYFALARYGMLFHTTLGFAVRCAVPRRVGRTARFSYGTSSRCPSSNTPLRTRAKGANIKVHVDSTCPARTRQAHIGPPNPRTYFTCKASAAPKLGPWPGEAEQLCESARECRAQALGLDHPDSMRSARQLAALLRATGRAAEGEQPLCGRLWMAARRPSARTTRTRWRAPSSWARP